jgi:drug/metabolite transporter (DMT)-like permease
VLLALIARFALHEKISLTRWLGIALVSTGVGFVTSGPELTGRSPHRPIARDDRARGHS